MTHDPTINPRPGDVLSKPSVPIWGEVRRIKTRRVTQADADGVIYNDGRVSRVCVLSAWRRWAKSADVIATEEA